MITTIQNKNLNALARTLLVVRVILELTLSCKELRIPNYLSFCIFNTY